MKDRALKWMIWKYLKISFYFYKILYTMAKKKSMALKVFDLFLRNVDERVSIKQLRNACKESQSMRPRENIIYLLRKQGIRIDNSR